MKNTYPVKIEKIKAKKRRVNEAQKVGFSYGAVSRTLEKQANDQGFTLGNYKNHFEDIAVCIQKIRWGIRLPEKAYSSLLKRLNKYVVDNLIPLEKNRDT